jgi:hypothetical protein
LTLAARHAGLSPETLRRWLRQSRSFEAEVVRACADWELGMIAAATKQSRLGRLDPVKVLAAHPRTRAEWGPRAQVAVEGDPQPVKVAVAAVGNVDARVELAALARTLDVLVQAGVFPPPPLVGDE